MITAKNYAAQAVSGLRIFANTASEHKQDREFAERLAEIIIDSEHFVINDDAIILDDGLKGLKNQSLNLPFETITVEFFMSGMWSGGTPSKAIVVATDYEDSIIIYGALTAVGNKHWIPSAHAMKVPKDIYIGSIRDESNADVRIVCPGLYAEMGTDTCFSIIGSFELCLEELLEALSCKNVSIATYQKDSPKNEKRTKRGKLPFYETKMLVVDSAKNSVSAKGDYTPSSTHASPRQHLRRGHIRRLPGGNIWVNSCVVGDASKGTISKIYTVV